MLDELKQAKELMEESKLTRQKAIALADKARFNYELKLRGYDLSDSPYIEATQHIGEELDLIPKDASKGQWALKCKILMFEYNGLEGFAEFALEQISVFQFIELLIIKSQLEICWQKCKTEDEIVKYLNENKPYEYTWDMPLILKSFKNGYKFTLGMVKRCDKKEECEQ